ncbi:uncharacterized protein BDR25DRAFT_335262 [Lindgomyces ingoldianus]|uniref:Uncharacterized protein n=1 Tax=Lindgomyces ingoldianus TaxID=673940 RepID=A0ACB6QPM9_9PLEO|nr:uncharacterized protein BDR25DRAFT_335262 [Lindgomyces ingoldianus]KAF2468918.1 hypothetical protein BDR25DRAFT_335262 [Lindgomyces ingoldianus]
MAGADDDHNGDAAASDVQAASRLHPQPPQKRRRTQGTTSTRGVANLTPEQLARKRANDREAQRAIRERTKNQIDRLNQRIRELENQQPYHDLQVVLLEKDAIRAENDDIRRRLEAVVSMLQPVLRQSGGLNELAAAAERSPLPIPRDPASHPPDHRAFRTGLVALQEATSPRQNGVSVHSPDTPDAGRQWLFPGEPPTSHVRRWQGESPQFDHARTSHVHSEMPFDERLGVDFILDNNQRRVDPNLPPPHQPTTANGFGQHAPTMVPHLTFPRTIPATCPLDVLMLDFLADRHARAAEGVPIKTLVGPLYPNFTALVYRDRNVDAHPLSKLFTDILRTFPDISGLPEQVAVVFIMFLIMRWQVEPTQENYDRLPDWVTPRASQLFVPHPYWMDHLPWPRLRDRCIAAQPFTPLDTFFIPFTTTVSLNWPYEARDCLLPASKIHSSSLSSTSSIPASSPYSTAVHAGSPPGPPTPGPAVSTPGTVSAVGKEDEQWLINPAFESHLRDLRNWSLGPAFRTAFPQFADAVRIKDGR